MGIYVLVFVLWGLCVCPGAMIALILIWVAAMCVNSLFSVRLYK